MIEKGRCKYNLKTVCKFGYAEPISILCKDKYL